MTNRLCPRGQRWFCQESADPGALDGACSTCDPIPESNARPRSRSVPVRMSDAEKLARGVLLYFDASPWTADKQEQWHLVTGTDEANSKNLCDMARRVRQREEAK